MQIRHLVFGYLTTLLLLANPAQAFETSNIQLLYSNQFDGDAFIYDTDNGYKTTVTLEHFRVGKYGDLFLFVDAMYGKKFNGDNSELYGEIAPRLSLSKLSNQNLDTFWSKDFYIASQLNLGDGYDAWLLGLGTDLKIPKFNFVSVNLYQKRDNLKNQLTQLTASYQTESFGAFHIEGFFDLTEQDIHTHNQLLYNMTNTNNPFYVGMEWIRYHYDHKSITNDTNALQLMAKYKF